MTAPAAALDLFGAFTQSAWRLETRPFYEADRAEFERAQAGLEPTPEQAASRQAWLAKLTAARDEGRTVGRVLLHHQPLDDYLRWRVDTGGAHVAAGEDIRLADIGAHPDLGGLFMDFWLLDDARVWVLDYDDAGRFTALMPTQVRTAVEACRRYRALAVAASVPLQEFMAAA